MKTKKIPMRRCMGCGESFEKKTLVRVVKDNEDNVSLDLTGKKNGRGAYVCRNIECLKKARKKKSFERSLGVEISAEIYDTMEKEIDAE